MKRFLIFVSAHLFLFLLVIAYQAQADHEEWTIDKYESLSYARVSGEVTHGDSLNFFILSRENCETVYNNFTFYTYENPADIYQLEGKNIPIKINGEELTAQVRSISPFLMGFRVSFSLRTYPLKEYQEMRDRERAEELKRLREEDNRVKFTSVEPLRKDPNRGMRFLGSCSDPINVGKLGSSRSFIKKKDKEYY